MNHRPSLQDTLRAVEDYLGRDKVAHAAPPAAAPAETPDDLPGVTRKLAAHLRELGSAPVVVTDDDLYAVLKTAASAPAPLAAPPEGDGPDAALRKLAWAARRAGAARREATLAKAASTIDAAEGLTLLREHLRDRA